MEKATAKRRGRLAVVSLVALAIFVDTGFARDLDADGRTSARSGSVDFELNERTTFEDGEEEDTVDGGEAWRVANVLFAREKVCSIQENEAPGSQKLAPQENNNQVHVLNKKRTVKCEHKNNRNRWIRSKEMHINGFEMEEPSAAKDGRRQSPDHS